MRIGLEGRPQTIRLIKWDLNTLMQPTRTIVESLDMRRSTSITVCSMIQTHSPRLRVLCMTTIPRSLDLSLRWLDQDSVTGIHRNVRILHNESFQITLRMPDGKPPFLGHILVAKALLNSSRIPNRSLPSCTTFSNMVHQRVSMAPSQAQELYTDIRVLRIFSHDLRTPTRKPVA